jgi:hypothetical protein
MPGNQAGPWIGIAAATPSTGEGATPTAEEEPGGIWAFLEGAHEEL